MIFSLSEPKPSVAKGVSLVIPSNNSRAELIVLLKTVFEGNVLPDEILIIQSGSSGAIQKAVWATLDLPELIELNSTLFRGVRVKILHLDFAYPGEARNIGVNHARGDLIGFLDLKTMPKPNWLESAFELLKNCNLDGVWGSTSYESRSIFGNLVRDAIYGRLPVRSVAGTVFRRQVYSVTGAMISWAPAGEDGDWIHRVEAHKLSFFMPNQATHRYQGLDKRSLTFFIRKWWRYYHYSRLLPVNNRDRWLSFGLLYVVLLFFAFNWNYKISAAILGSPFVVPHITTGLAVTGPLAYALIRGVYWPLRRGVPLFQILPGRFILLLTVACILDSVKIFGLLLPLPSYHIQRKRFSK